MKKQLCAIFTAAALTCALSLPAAAQQKSTAKLKRVQLKEEKAKHPEMAAGMAHLREARENLEHAKGDFDGHRAAALKHINEALEECRKALAADKN